MLKKLENIIGNFKYVVDFDLDVEDKFADYDFLITFENSWDTKDFINDLKFEIEDKIQGISVKTFFEQIDNEIDRGGFFVTVDFYCYVNN